MAIDTSSAGSLIGGLRPADPYLETYLVRPGGLTVMVLGPDDRVTVTDVDGGQPAELTALSPDGSRGARRDRDHRRRARHGAAGPGGVGEPTELRTCSPTSRPVVSTRRRPWLPGCSTGSGRPARRPRWSPIAT